MMIATEKLTIYFGNSEDNICASDEKRNEWSKQANILELPLFAHLKNSMEIQNLIFDHQVHGCSGRLVTTTSTDNLHSWSHNGDFLITQDINVGIGVLTADCLPIIIHDSTHDAIGIIHAGWRGSVQGIAIKALQAMNNSFYTQINDVTIYFGPCIGSCCYTIGSEVIQALDTNAKHVLETRNNNIYFNLKAYNEYLLLQCGIPQTAFNSTYSNCTYCNESYNSYRRNATQYRQLTVACLKNHLK